MNLFMKLFGENIRVISGKIGSQQDIEADLRQILEGAIPLFKFPRVSLERDENGFKEDFIQRGNSNSSDLYEM